MLPSAIFSYNVIIMASTGRVRRACTDGRLPVPHGGVCNSRGALPENGGGDGADGYPHRA